ncbi:catalytic domain of components of various dehydrogenase complexes [Xylanimonas cellulosilytica DSM 15894]|uniref:Dihydrolipoamide acetyltransferase component of pyruvate dehydrogenase complex n=1 Tax=Xylanimonas cellulosilytica (strain DSM 15894 / JCM 12276 / CECT 5975 / KCTC 9989 / LMG 20990 / NBRC 107835 / XIL07) TaxID=446471 RepID=D1C0L8_XYLCX|nr:dihydrolipoamide acetyltransferase family protein [Xylanimonas cellulosilytica]ACZ32221.1 catalytic domain of components of various dehydrogenase complexes [Xylanimonas cellulosilytica DSM 15894]
MSTQRFPLPDVGEGLTEAEIVEWKVAVGDTVTVNQVIVEIETAKSLVELPSPWAGTVVALLAEEGDTVDVGTPIIEVSSTPVVEPVETTPPTPVADPADSTEPPSVVEPVETTPTAEGSGSVLVGYGTADAVAGRRRRRGTQPPALTQPTTRPQPPAAPPALSGAQGSAARRGPDNGSVVGGVSGAGSAGARRGPDTSSGAVRVAPDAGAVSVPAAGGNGDAAHGRVLAKPPVRKLAKELGVDLATVAPTGPGGIVTREDLVAHAEAAKPQTLATYADDDRPWLASGSVASDGRSTRVPVKSVRKRTAEAMVASAFTAPHVTVFHTVDVSKTMKLVAALKADREFADVRVTPLLIAAKAVLLAVNRHPEINASWDDAAQEIVYKHYVNLGIAAATPRGLVVPNIKGAHRLDLLHLAREIANLTATARAGRTTPADMSDGTFTITNVGVFGIDTGTPILNPGEAGILAFGAIRQTPWVHKGKIKPRWVTNLSLSFDHRLVDGELGSRFLSDVARVLEDPARALTWV